MCLNGGATRGERANSTQGPSCCETMLNKWWLFCSLCFIYIILTLLEFLKIVVTLTLTYYYFCLLFVCLQTLKKDWPHGKTEKYQTCQGENSPVFQCSQSPINSNSMCSYMWNEKANRTWTNLYACYTECRMKEQTAHRRVKAHTVSSSVFPYIHVSHRPLPGPLIISSNLILSVKMTMMEMAIIPSMHSEWNISQ